MSGDPLCHSSILTCWFWADVLAIPIFCPVITLLPLVVNISAIPEYLDMKLLGCCIIITLPVSGV